MIFLTGGTGFLGSELLCRLLIAEPKEQFGLLVRADSDAHSEKRVSRLLAENFGPSWERFRDRVAIVRGDVSLPYFGLGQSEFQELALKTHEIYHCAATTTLDLPIEEVRAINVGGTENTLALARQRLSSGEKASHFHHVSTAYVAGGNERVVAPSELSLNWNFRNSYEQAKAESEALVRYTPEKLPYTVYRPSVIVGDSITGQTSAFNVIYVPARLLARGLCTAFPARPHAPFDVVPVDYVADAILYLRKCNDLSGKSFHLSAGLGRESSPLEIIEVFFKTINEYRIGKGLIHAPPLLSPEKLAQMLLAISSSAPMRNLEKLVVSRIGLFRQMIPFIPYMTSNPQFDSSSTVRELTGTLPEPPLFSAYAERIFQYCFDTEWGKNPWTNPLKRTPWGERLTPKCYRLQSS